MENISNKTLLTTMLIIGVILALMIIPLYPTNRSTTFNSGGILGANAYMGFNEIDSNSINLNTNYNVAPFRTSGTRTITESSNLSTKQIYYYTTEDANLPDETGYGSYYSTEYIPAGCESGTDYSLTTGEPCG